MRILVIIIAILAQLGGIAEFFGGISGLFSGVLMLTTDFENVPEIAAASEMSPQTIGLIFLLITFLMSFNGLILIIFAGGAFYQEAPGASPWNFRLRAQYFRFSDKDSDLDAAGLDDSVYLRQFRGVRLYNYSGVLEKRL